MYFLDNEINALVTSQKRETSAPPENEKLHALYLKQGPMPFYVPEKVTSMPIRREHGTLS